MAGRKLSRPAVAAIVAGHLIVTALTWRDLRRRPDAHVRGNKKMWRAASALNTSNSLLYLLFGRKRSTV